MGVGATDGSAVESGTVLSAVAVGSVEQAPNNTTVIMTAKIVVAERLLEWNDKGLFLDGGSALFIDMGQVFPHVEHLHRVGGARYTW